jgi:hypothetical protein
MHVPFDSVCSAAGGAEAKRAFGAIMSMKKIDIAAIEAARRPTPDGVGVRSTLSDSALSVERRRNHQLRSRREE